jgi:hypothetical protein
MVRMFSIASRAALFCGLILGLCGCGDWATVEGDVKLDNRSLDDGLVTFHPIGEGPLAYGTVDPSGRYSMKTGDQVGLKPGEYVVTVVKSKVPDMTSRNPVVTMLTPPKYADRAKTDLKVTVRSGSNTLPLELKSK